MQWTPNARPQEQRRPYRDVLDALQERVRPFIERQPEFARPAYGSVLQSGADMLPGVGDVVGVEDLQAAARDGDPVGIGLGLLAAIPGIPAIGRGSRGARRGLMTGAREAAPSGGLMTDAESALARYRAVNPDDTGARVLNPGDEGYPTNAQWDEASQAYVAPTPSPAPPQREPYLQAAVRADGKVYRGNTHIDAVAAMPPDVRRRHGMDGNNRGYVNDRGRFLNRAKAQDYARDYGLFREDAPSWVSTAPELASEYLRPYSPPAPVEPSYPIRAFHGSPHSFDRFSLDKIGTGEGAQAYGHGLYFAESEDVARGYRDQLSHQGPMIGGAPIQSGHLSGAAARFRTVDDYIAAMEPRLEEARQAVIDGDDLEALLSQARPQTIQKQIDEARQYAGQEFGHGYHGSMYEVGINAHPDTFLDWDAPLSRQPSQIDAAFAEMGTNRQELAEILFDNGTIDEPRLTGERIYEKLADFTSGPDAVSDVMARNGINGIRYLDGNSRGAGEGSSNYVVFNDELVKILRKYGISGLGLTGGAALGGGLLGSPQDQQAQPTTF